MYCYCNNNNSNCNISWMESYNLNSCKLYVWTQNVPASTELLLLLGIFRVQGLGTKSNERKMEYCMTTPTY